MNSEEIVFFEKIKKDISGKLYSRISEAEDYDVSIEYDRLDIVLSKIIPENIEKELVAHFKDLGYGIEFFKNKEIGQIAVLRNLIQVLGLKLPPISPS